MVIDAEKVAENQYAKCRKTDVFRVHRGLRLSLESEAAARRAADFGQGANRPVTSEADWIGSRYLIYAKYPERLGSPSSTV